jgi:hypothetical protein
LSVVRNPFSAARRHGITSGPLFGINQVELTDDICAYLHTFHSIIHQLYLTIASSHSSQQTLPLSPSCPLSSKRQLGSPFRHLFDPENQKSINFSFARTDQKSTTFCSLSLLSSSVSALFLYHFRFELLLLSLRFLISSFSLFIPSFFSKL